MSIVIKKTSEKELTLTSPEWNETECIAISCVNWGKPEKEVKACAKLLHTDEGIYARYSANEQPVVVEHRKHGDDVYKDSTVELFIKPDKNAPHHFNFEVNAEGYAIIGFGIARERNRFREDELDFSRFRIHTEIKEDGFDVLFFVPFDFLLEYSEEISDVVTCNLFKCCEADGHLHHYSAFPINTEKPNFHVAEAFEEFILE